jgi:hypothetical protein
MFANTEREKREKREKRETEEREKCKTKCVSKEFKVYIIINW